jgi:hypothetical protein
LAAQGLFTLSGVTRFDGLSVHRASTNVHRWRLQVETNFPDERLELIFMCCHPALALEAQVALTLRALGGLTTEENGHIRNDTRDHSRRIVDASFSPICRRNRA